MVEGRMAEADSVSRIPMRASRRVQLTVLAWLAMLGFDFFLHGGLLAGSYVQGGPFFLPLAVAFRRIPIGYLGFLISAAFLVWLLARVGITGWRAGAATGAGVGAVIWLSLTLGLYSISTAPPELLAGWAIGQTVEMAYAGAVVGEGLKFHPLRKQFLIVVVATIAFIIATIALQSAGLAPAVVVD